MSETGTKSTEKGGGELFTKKEWKVMLKKANPKVSEVAARSEQEMSLEKTRAALNVMRGERRGR